MACGTRQLNSGICCDEYYKFDRPVSSVKNMALRRKRKNNESLPNFS